MEKIITDPNLMLIIISGLISYEISHELYEEEKSKMDTYVQVSVWGFVAVHFAGVISDYLVSRRIGASSPIFEHYKIFLSLLNSIFLGARGAIKIWIIKTLTFVKRMVNKVKVLALLIREEKLSEDILVYKAGDHTEYIGIVAKFMKKDEEGDVPFGKRVLLIAPIFRKEYLVDEIRGELFVDKLDALNLISPRPNMLARNEAVPFFEKTNEWAYIRYEDIQEIRAPKPSDLVVDDSFKASVKANIIEYREGVGRNSKKRRK